MIFFFGIFLIFYEKYNCRITEFELNLSGTEMVSEVIFHKLLQLKFKLKYCIIFNLISNIFSMYMWLIL